MDLGQQLRLWADELHAIANEGQQWSGENPYDKARYARVARIGAALFAAQSGDPASLIEQVYESDPAHCSPDIGGDAAIFNQHDQILLIRRRDDGLWAMPGGLIEVGETPAEGTCREAWEETGIAVRPQLLVGVYDSRRVGSRTRRHLLHFVFLCQPLDEESQAIVTSETLDARWFAVDQLPALSPGHASRIADALRAWDGQRAEAFFD